ncbi:hypothetical protein B9J90_05570 [Vibrio sp. V09_P4A23P171]|uniref:porin n=1 Tax=Vibrio sp. V09_P4A23P171 TaxID=1938664 RepID=UPI000B8E648F|nr:porin [Vibrio sp. V09_P4A23P171]OXX37807.1 hypothetical protein B9J90_05570 [Vibrio sp. V09_P4A23P171]
MIKAKYSLYPALMLLPGLSIADESVEARVSQLENELAILKSSSSSSWQDSIKFNGFFSVGVTRSSNKLGYASSRDSYSFDELSLVGLQAEFSLADKTSFVTQLIARGSDDFSPDIEWAYLKHTFDNYVTVRAGKLRVPLYMYSDYIDVGFAQPWSRPPVEVYGNVPFNSYLGGDIAYDVEMDESTLYLQAFAGQSKTSDNNTEYNYMYGASLGWNYDYLTIRAVYGTTKITSGHSVFKQVVAPDTIAKFYGTGLSYDNGSLLFVTELTRTEVEGQYSDVDSAYATLGYRIQSWVPYVSVATLRTKDDDERIGKLINTGTANIPSAWLFDAERNAYSAGVRYDLLSNLSIKADVTMIDNFGDTSGLIGSTNFGNTGKALEDDSLIYSIRLDGVF